MPFGSVSWIGGSSLVTAAAVVSGLAAGVGKMARKMPGLPLKWTLVSVLSAASSTLATSRSRTTLPSFRPQRQLGERLRRLQRRAHGDRRDDISFWVLPGADRKLELLIAASTSDAVTPRAASLTGSIQTRIEYSWAPKICTSATPSTVDMRGRMTRSIYSVSCSLRHVRVLHRDVHHREC